MASAAADLNVHKLNIPLSRHTKTTRPLGQVVWLLGLCGLALLFLSWRLFELWYARDTILAAAPEGTVLALQLEITPASWSTIYALLEDVPLISNRSLDVRDVASFARGELALFVSQTGSRSVAVRAQEGELPSSLLSALSITSQEVAPGIFLLAETLLPVSGIDTSARRPFLGSLSKRWLGRVELPDVGLSGSLFQEDDRFEVVLPNKTHWRPSGKVLPQAVLALIGNPGLSESLSREPFSLFNQFLEGSWSVLVQKNDLGEPEVAFAAQNAGVQESDLMSLLQLMGAYLSPTLQESVLPDGTLLQEIFVEPELVTIEEVQVAGVRALRVLGKNERFLFGALIDDRLILATSEPSLISFIDPEEALSDCRGNALFLSPQALLDEVSVNAYNPTIQALTQIFSQFSSISVEMKKYSSTVSFCST